MKISEVVTLHPAIAAKSEYDMLQRAGEEQMDDIIGYIMDDHNAEARRLNMLRHLDELQGGVKDTYDVSELQDFMYDQDDPPESKHPHLKLVDNTQDKETPTGEYEICQRCGGKGCSECEEGLKDITGMHQIPNFDDLDNA